MRKVRKLLLGFGVALAVAVVGVGFAAATNDQSVSGTNNKTIYKTGNTVTVTGVVNGDVFCVGQTVDIDATVNGDVICAGQTVTVDGTVNGNIRVGGQTVSIGAHVTRNASVAATTATLQNNASVNGDLTLVAQTANLDGSVGRDIHGDVHTLNINNKVGRNVDVSVNKLSLGSGANIGNNVTYSSQNKLTQANGATIGGTVSYTKATEHHHNFGGWGNRWAWQGYILLSLLVLALVLVAIFPQSFVRLNKLAAGRIWIALLTGFIAMFVVPALIFALLITAVGIPLAILVGLAWVVLLILSAPVSAFYVGRLAWANANAVWAMLVGSIILGILYLIPIIGVIVTVLAVWFGSGALLLSLRAGYKKPAYKTN